MPQLAVDTDVAIALLHDAVDGGEAEAGAVARALGGEERLEEPRLDGTVHADAVVAHGQRHVGAWIYPRVEGRILGGQGDVRRLDGEPAAVGHRVARVHREVDDHLFELARIHPHPPGVRRRHEGQVDVLSDQPLEEIRRVLDQLVQVEHLRLEHLLAAEREQLVRERRRAGRGLVDEVELAPQRVARRHPSEGELAPAADHGQQVVEIVRDAARQLADALHPLGVEQLQLELLSAGDVLHDRHEVLRLA